MADQYKFNPLTGKLDIASPIPMASALTAGATEGSIIFVDAFGKFNQDNAHLYWKYGNSYLGLGTNDPQGPLDVRGTYADGALAARITNSSNSSAASAVWRAINDAGTLSEVGTGSSGRTDLLAGCMYLYASAGGTTFYNGDSNPFRWTIGGTDTGSKVMELDSTGKLTTKKVVLNGSSSGAVTITPAATAGTWTFKLPTSAGDPDQVLTTDGSGNTSWVDLPSGGGGAAAIGDSVGSSTAGSVLFVDGSNDLAQDNSNFYWDATNHRLGLGTTTPSAPLDISGSANGASIRGNTYNADSNGTAAWRSTNDASRFAEFGFAGSGVGGALQNKAYVFSNTGGLAFQNGDASSFHFWINGSEKATLDANGQLGLGTSSPQGPLDLVKTASGDSVDVRVRNLASDGVAAIRAVSDANAGNFCFFGYGGSGRGDGLADRGFIYAQNGGFNLSVAGSNTFEVTIGGIGTSDRALEIDGNKNVVIGNGALSTSATDGFFYADSCAGTPSGTPTTKSGRIPVVIDSSNSKLYAYIGGAWKSVTLS
jgi:hypothetical protein